jgi:hypothetical protein
MPSIMTAEALMAEQAANLTGEATLDLGPEIAGMAGRQLRMRIVTIEPGRVFGPIHDHRDRPSMVYIPRKRANGDPCHDG